MRRLLGIHHVTAIAGDPQENVDFYVGVLGLRLVKITVNQDDPGTYHLFYADYVGNPGTDLTFFAWPGANHGREGAGQAIRVALAIPQTATRYWTRRLTANGIPFEGPFRRFEGDVIALSDYQGFPLELVATADAIRREPWTPWADGPIPAEYAIRGIHGVTLKETAEQPTVPFLTEQLGFRRVGEEDGHARFAAGPGGSGAWLDLVIDATARHGQIAVGSIHHVALRTPDAVGQRQWWAQIRSLGVPISDVIDRFWFKSIYFREPGGVLFEIATDGPGFTADEQPEKLGSRLVLPPWLESQREQIEQALPPIRLPEQIAQAR